MNSKFIKFAASAFMGFLIDYVLFCSLSLIFSDKKIYILLANIIARIISAACNYMANCLFVFEEKQRLWSALSYFLLAVFILFMNNIVLLIYSGVIPLYCENTDRADTFYCKLPHPEEIYF